MNRNFDVLSTEELDAVCNELNRDLAGLPSGSPEYMRVLKALQAANQARLHSCGIVIGGIAQ